MFLIYLIAPRSPPGQEEWMSRWREEWMKGGRPDYVNIWGRRCTHKIKEAMQTYIQEGFETKWKNNEKPPPNAPKSTQNGPKTKPRGTRNPTIVFKTTWEAPGGRFPGYRAPVMAQLGPQNEAKNAKKNNLKNHWIFDHPFDAKNVRKWTPKPLQNRPQDGPKLSSKGSRSETQEKCKNDQPSIVFGTFLVSAGVENPTNFFKKWCRKRVENQVRFRSRFLKDLGGFWSHLGTQDRPKMEEKRYRKTERF